MYQSVSGSGFVPEGLVPEYILQLVKMPFCNILFTHSDENKFDSVFVIYEKKDLIEITDWAKGKNWENLLLKITDSSSNKRKKAFLKEREFASKQGWRQAGQKLEIKVNLENKEFFYIKAKSFPEGRSSGRVADLIAKKVHDTHRANILAEVMTSSKNSVSKVIYQKRKIMAFAHALYFQKQEKAIMDYLYVDPHYGKGKFDQKIFSSLCWEVHNRGAKNIYSLVEKKEIKRIGFLMEQGAEFTDFRKYGFKI